MKNLFVAGLLVFMGGLSLVMGSRLSVDAVTVIVGVGCGVLASIPTSVLILAVTARRETRLEPMRGQQAYPPVVVVNSPPNSFQGGQGWSTYNSGLFAPTPPNSRQFHVIGQDDETFGNYPNPDF